MKKLSTQLYKNTFVSTFSGDESGDLNPRQTPDVFYSKAIPTPVRKPALLGWSDELAEELGVQKPSDQKDIDILGGNYLTPTMSPYAARYGGHQFGNWAAQLGDGRAITLGEWEHEGKSWDLQLKGAGPTAYSRRADGRAVLRSSVREYLMSEAMFHLGVPTTRALSLVSTGEQIMRDMFYNGNPEYEPGAIVMRVAPTFIRFGNFEIFTSKNEIENLKKLTDYTIDRFYPHISGEDKIGADRAALADRREDDRLLELALVIILAEAAEQLRGADQRRLAKRTVSVVRAGERIGGSNGNGLHEQHAPVDVGPPTTTGLRTRCAYPRRITRMPSIASHPMNRGLSQAVFCAVSPSFSIVCSRITNFWILPVMVIGNSGTNSM